MKANAAVLIVFLVVLFSFSCGPDNQQISSKNCVDCKGEANVNKVGVDGGVIVHDETGIVLTILPGTLKKDHAIVLNTLKAEDFVSPPDMKLLNGIELSGLVKEDIEPGKFMILEMPLSGVYEPLSPLANLTRSGMGDVWQNVGDQYGLLPATVNVDGTKAVALIDSFSQHAIAQRQTTPLNHVVIGERNGVVHYCLEASSFAAWSGPVLNYNSGLWVESYRKSIYESAFTQMILLESKDNPDGKLFEQLYEALKKDGEDGAKVVSTTKKTLSITAAFDATTRAARKVFQVVGNKPSTYKHTTFFNIRKRLSNMNAALNGIAPAITITNDYMHVWVIWASYSSMQLAKLDMLADFLKTTGLDQDPAIKEAFDVVDNNVRVRVKDEEGNIIQFIKDHASSNIPLAATAAFEGFKIWLPIYLAPKLTKLGFKGASLAKLSLGVGTALDLLSYNNKVQRKDARICAYSTLSIYTDLIPQSLDREEIFYTARTLMSQERKDVFDMEKQGLFEEYFKKAVAGVVGKDLDELVTFWDSEASTALMGLDHITTLRFLNGTEVFGPSNLPTQSQSPGVVISPNGMSVLAWPFDNPNFHNVEGSKFHQCDDAYALDLNTRVGSCDAEITYGPMYVYAPISGKVVFAGSSSFTPGLGYRVIIESDQVPGFYVLLAHLQPFDDKVLKVGTEVQAGQSLNVAVGDTAGGSDLCAHLHIVAYRNVLDDAAIKRILQGQSPQLGYTCDYSQYAAPFTFEAKLSRNGAKTLVCPHRDGRYCGDSDKAQQEGVLYTCRSGYYLEVKTCEQGCQQMNAGTHDQCVEDVGQEPCGNARDGWWCDSELMGQMSNQRRYCKDGLTDQVEVCAEGCMPIPNKNSVCVEPSQCVDQCNLGQRVCNGDQYRICEESMGCKRWSSLKNCGPNEACEGMGTCVPQNTSNCSGGPCCDGGNYRSSSFVCNTITSYRCASNNCGGDAQSKVEEQYCSGNSSACDGQTVTGSWQDIDNCSSSEKCTATANSASCYSANECSSCTASKYWSPDNTKGADSSGKQRTTTLNVKLEFELQDANSSGKAQFRVCKYDGSGNASNFTGGQIHVHYVNQWAPNHDTTMYEGSVNTSSSSNCTSWIDMNHTFNAGQKVGGVVRIVSPSSSSSKWGNQCSGPSGSGAGTCWFVTDTGSMTRTCK